jgi:hypothetical protein
MTAPVASPAAAPTTHYGPERDRGVATAEITGLDFWDLLDIVNPLQHLPIVSAIYRAVTGDTIKPLMRVLGGALYGGPAGLLTAYASAVVEERTGREPLAQLVALVRGDGDAPPRSAPLVASGPPLSLVPPARPMAQGAALPIAGVSAPASPPAWLGAALDEAKTARDRRAEQP